MRVKNGEHDPYIFNHTHRLPLRKQVYTASCLQCFLHIKFKPDTLIPGQQSKSFLYVIFIDMDVAKVKRDRFQPEIDLAGHQVQMVNIGRQSEIRIAATLVSRYNQLALVNLELYQAKAWGLDCFRHRSRPGTARSSCCYVSPG